MTSGVRVEVLAQSSCSTVGESPHWDEVTQSLLYVDIRAGDVHRWDNGTGQDTLVHLDAPVGFVVPRSAGGYVVGLGPSLSSLDWHTGTVTGQLARVDADRFNDGKCDPSGRLWSGTLGPEPSQRALYCLDTSRHLRRCLDTVQLANGMAWSSDHNIMYFVDTAPRHVYAFDFDKDTGNIGNQRIVVDFNQLGPVSEVGKPDGLCIDTDNNLWVASFGGGMVSCFNTTTGEEVQRVHFPQAKQTTSCCFGGPHYTDLYVTSAKSRLSTEEEKAQPLAGSLFKVTGLGVKGLPPAVFEG